MRLYELAFVAARVAGSGTQIFDARSTYADFDACFDICLIHPETCPYSLTQENGNCYGLFWNQDGTICCFNSGPCDFKELPVTVTDAEAILNGESVAPIYLSGARGLLNNSSICYLNAVVQVLGHARNFKILMQNIFRLNEMNVIAKFFTQQDISSRESLDAAPVRDALGFRPYRQEDSHEGLLALLASLEPELEEEGKRNIIARLFDVTTERGMEYITGERSVRQIYERGITLPLLPESNNLITLLKQYVAPYVADENLGDASNALVNLSVRKLPQLLWVQLGRFDVVVQLVRSERKIIPVKRENEISIPRDIDFSEIPGFPPQQYKLIGVVLHTGSASSGHYTAEFVHEGQWYTGDDSVVVPGGPTLNGPNPYLLLYERVAL